MTIIRLIHKYRVQALLGVLALAAAWLMKDLLFEGYRLISDREAIKAYLSSWGNAGPFVFILIQILQVLLAPVPGEFSGFAGGYVFGAAWGFIYSSIGLAAGSAINFGIGRALGFRLVRKLVSSSNLEKFDRFLSHQGLLVLLGMFLFPGFPKDYLCLLLGSTALPFKIFILLSGFGRMPGTLMLSLQGEFLFEGRYVLLAGVLAVGLLVGGLAYRWRRRLYQWAEEGSFK